MNPYILPVLTLICAGIGIAWVMNGRWQLGSMRNVFLLVAGYFALCVPVDLLLGIELRGGRELLADLNDELFRAEIARILLLYIECIICFVAMYTWLPWREDPHWRVRDYRVWQLPLAVVIVVNVASLLLYLVVFGDLPRIDRLLLARQSTLYKLLTLSVTGTQTLNFVFLLQCEDRRKARWVVALSILFALYSGGRMWGAATVLFYLMRYQVPLRRWAVVALAATFVVCSLVWKELTHHFWETGQLAVFWNSNVSYGMSRFEGIQSWVMAVEILHDEQSPYWLGWSYSVLPLQMTWPRFLMEYPPQTLAEQYALALRPTLFEAGGGIGFSAIGEAWLNFGFIGPGLLGCLWGAIAKWIDSRPRGVTAIIFFLMTMRLFRSDFASLYKSWCVMFAASLCLLLLLLYVVRGIQRSGERRTVLSRFGGAPWRVSRSNWEKPA